MTIHVVYGPPCSGKSSYVAEHAEPGTPRFDHDAIASVVAGHQLNHDVPSGVGKLVTAMRRGMVGYLLDEETPTPTTWLIWAWPPQKLIDVFAEMGAEFHLVDPGKEECIARAMRDNRPPGTVERIQQWYDNPPVVPVSEEKGGEMQQLIKSFEVKADSLDETTGEFTGYASVFDVTDSYGDVVRKGAFTATLKEWADSGRTLPVLYGHDFKDPFSNIGGVTSAVEDEVGLKITATLDLDNPKAAQVHRLLKQGRLSEMSFAYYVREASWVTENEKEVYELRDLKLLEVSVVPIGANPATSITDVKALLSTAVKQAEATERDALTAALDALDTPSKTSEGSGDSSDSASGRANALRAHLAFLEAF